jgi:hypothetical protein
MVTLARVLPLCALVLALPSMLLPSFALAQGRPEFVSPVNGQKLEYNGSYMFRVKPIANAQFNSTLAILLKMRYQGK